jgi:phage FluMu gp28-like protein
LSDTHAIHSELLASDAANAMPPAVLLPYQQAWVADDSQFKIAEKSRRIGLTWAEASDDVLQAASEGGSNVFYIGPTQDMALEFIEACGMWARAFDSAAAEIEEGIFVDSAAGENGADKAIKTYKIDFPHTGRRIVALSSRPTNLRGKQGIIVIDEAAFHNDLAALLKAAMAMLLWGDKVRIISTHDGVDNQFNELIQEVRAKKRGGSVHRITFRDAVTQGLYRRVCLRRGIEWTAENEAKWVADAYSFYGDDAAEELDVIPSQGGGAYLSMALIERCMSKETPIVRGKWNAEFNAQPEHIRRLEIEEWCEQKLAPVFSTLSKFTRHAIGEDFARIADLTCLTIGEEGHDLVRRVKLHVELSNCPFTQQEQIIYYIIDRLPNFFAGAFDAGGNGAGTAEKVSDRYGATRIEQVKLSNAIYLESMPVFKAALEDGNLKDIPQDKQVSDDLRAIQLIDGIPKLGHAKTQKADGEKVTRHGDAAISLFMLHRAMKNDVPDPRGVKTTGIERSSSGLSDFMG